MDRRNALKTLVAGGIFVPTFLRAEVEECFGWYPDNSSLRDFIRRHRRPFVSQLNSAIKGAGKGKKAFLHLAYERVSGKQYLPHRQEGPDCTSQAAALSVDFLASVQIAIKRAPQRWVAKAATEPIHGGSRVEIGGKTSGEGGAAGHWAAEWLSSYGILLRQEYPTGHDFRQYSASKVAEFGRSGCPDALEPLAKLHPVKKVAICHSYADLCDLVYNGIPVMVCSNIGFGSRPCTRDSEGFLTRKRRGWNHSMCFGGYDDSYRRKGALCFNSWGSSWVSGPTRGPQPSSTFWIDANTVDSMLRQGDSFAFSAYVGIPRTILPPFILY